MALQTQRFDGTVGTNVTTANSGFDLVNPNNNARFTYQDAPAPEPYGGTVGRIVAGAGEVNEGRYASSDATAAAAQALIYLTGHASAAVCDLIALRGTIQNSVVRYRADSTLTLMNNSSNDNSERRFTPPLDTWLVIDLAVEQGTTTSNGRNRYRVRRLDDLAGTPLIDYDSGHTVNAGVIGTHVINSYRIGKITSATAVVPTFYLAAFDVEDGRTTWLPDPEWPEPPAGDQVLVTLDGAWTPATPLLTLGGAWEPVTLT